MSDSPHQSDTSPTGSYAVVMLGFALQLILQLALQLLLARLYGSTRAMDAYLAAMTLPLALSALLAGSVGPVLITMLGGAPSARNNSALIGIVLGGSTIVATLLAGIGVMGAAPLMQALQPGFDPSKAEQTARLFRVLVWLIPANTLVGLLQSVLNASLNFAVPALAGVIGPAVTVVIVWQYGSEGIEAVAWGTVAGAAVSVLIQFAAARRQVAFLAGTDVWERVQGMLLLAGPVLAGSLVQRIDPLVDRYVTSELDDGRIAQLGYAYRLLSVFIMLASGTLSTVAFPHIARQSAADPEKLSREVGNGLAALLTLCLPALAAMLVFSQPLVKDLFERGAFTESDTAYVAMLLRYYAPMLLGAAAGELCGKTLYALKNTVMPNVVGGSFLVIGFVLKLVLVPIQGAVALAAVTSIVWVLAGAALLLLVVRRLGVGAVLSAVRAIPACLGATAGAVAVGFIAVRMNVPFPGVTGLVLGAVVYFGGLVLMGDRFRLLLKQLIVR